MEKDLSYIAEARASGGDCVTGGERLQRPTEGYYLAPALFVGTTNDMPINREEIFGPVAAVIKVADLDEAVAVSTDSDFALSSAICTTSLSAAESFRRRARTGMVMVNAPTAGVEYHVPFGGRSPSGYGAREQGTAAAEFFTESKTTYVNYGLPQGQ